MTYHMTDKEQIEMIKQWWNNYGKVIAITIIIGFVAAFGWRYWRQHQVQVSQKASELYGQLGIANSQKQPAVAEGVAAKLMQQYRKTPYATMAALWWAKELVDRKDYEGALQKIEWVTQHSCVKSFKQIARLRAARILLAQKKLSSAMNKLDTVDDKTFQPLINEAKGDIYIAMNKPNDAMKAYKSAKTGLAQSSLNNPILDMKVSEP